MKVLVLLCLFLGVEGQSSCIHEPQNASCANYLYPSSNSTADIKSLCSMMSMVGCEIHTLCSSGKLQSQKYCQPFSILADICAADGMGKMPSCSNYVSLCSKGSVVKQCATQHAIPEMVTTSIAKEDVLSMCNQMSMKGCEQCTTLTSCPTPLETLSTLCREMDMRQCAGYKDMCQATGSELQYLCSTSSPDQPPMMRMYFHTGIKDYILFESAVPSSNFGFAVACLCCIVLGVLSTLARIWRQHAMSSLSPASMIPLRESLGGFGGRKFCWKQNCAEAGFSVLIVTVDYSLMLLSMTFNVGIFLSVITGFALGKLFFSHRLSGKENTSHCSS
mmetsp:Transcript_18671/g.36550  ORF Transcript_18671/g.36550 Transcript_18671/m.36550 type:complete len:333 (+) Transcript_18671:36-1034(+)